MVQGPSMCMLNLNFSSGYMEPCWDNSIIIEQCSLRERKRALEMELEREILVVIEVEIEIDRSFSWQKYRERQTGVDRQTNKQIALYKKLKVMVIDIFQP